MKKLIALMLALLMLCSLFAACGQKTDTPTDNPGNTDDPGTSTDDPGKTDDPQQSEIVIKDFGGADYNILYNNVIPAGDYNEFTGNLGGDLVQYAIAERQYEVEKQFNVKINVTEKKGGWEERKEFTAAVRAEKMSGGTDNYDLIATHSVYLGWMGIEGLGEDMAKYSDYIDFSKPWWNQNLYDTLNLKDHVFMMIGDISLSVYEFVTVMFVNESQFEIYFQNEGGVDTLYDLVDAGEWTWEKLWEYASVFGTGANGDGKYGIYTGPHAWRASFISQEASLYKKDEVTGKLYAPNALQKKESDIIREMVEMYSHDNLAFDVFNFRGTGNETMTPLFQQSLVLFYPQTLDEAKKLFANAAEDYGIIPLPKYDVMQEMYKTQPRDTVTGVMIMCTSKDKERTAIVTEGMAYYGRQIMVPAYYEQSLVNRYVDKYTEILDMIRAGLDYPLGLCYVQNASGEAGSLVLDIFHQIVLGNGQQADSRYAGNVNAAQNELKTFYNKLAKLGIEY